MSDINNVDDQQGNLIDDDYDDVDDDIGNRVEGGTARSVLEYVARSIVDEPDAVIVETDSVSNGRIELSLSVAPDDMGKVIGKRGRVAYAIRTLVKAVARSEGSNANVDIID